MRKHIKYAIKFIRGIIKRNKTIFSIHRHLTDKDYQREKARMATCTIKSKDQIKREMREYSHYWGCPADDYVRYGLFDKNLSIEEILDYIPMQHFYTSFNDEMFKGINFRKDGDKLVQYKLLAERGIPQPEVIGIVRKRKLLSMDETPLSFEDLVNNTSEGEMLFFKPTDGNCGTGIVAVKKVNGILMLDETQVTSIAKLNLSGSSTFIIQRGLTQRSDFAAINDSSLNTLRTIVKYENGNAIIMAIKLRMGRRGSVVDNSGQGGVSVAVNPEDGSLGDYAGREHGGGIFYKHPDTGAVFKGTKLRDWSNVMAQIQDIVSRITEYKTIGWDIAVCEDKVYAIEMNLGWGIEGAQATFGGLRRRMGIYPKKRREYGS